MRALWHDLSYSVRTLARTPAFTAAVILSIALGIGANTTIFTLINTLFLNPLPVERPAELYAISTLDTKQSTQWGNILPLSYPNLVDLRDQNRVFDRLAGYSTILGLSLSTGGEPERVYGQLVTGDFFTTLGIRPAAGRFFLPEEDRTPGTHPVAVIGHGLWQRRFGGSPHIVGRTVRVNAHDVTIVGIAPRGFMGVTSLFGPDLWLPAMMAPHVLSSQAGNWLTDRGALSFTGIGRFKPGVTRVQADASLATLAHGLEEAFPAQNEGRAVSLLPVAEVTIFPGMRQGLLLGGLGLMAIVGLVLLIACSNVANLLLARASTRRHEMALRLALGAGRARIVRHMLTESLVLALFGGALGLVFAAWGRNMLWSYRPPDAINNFVELRLDGRVLLFALLLSLVTGVIFGIVPALRASRPDLVDALKDTRGSGGARGGYRLRHALVVAQMALSLVALAVAGLFLRGMARATAVQPGYDPKRLAVLAVNPGQAGFDAPRIDQFYRDVRDRLAAVGGIEKVSWSTNMPLWAYLYRGVVIDGQEQRTRRQATLTLVATVDLDYFATLGLRVRRGRDFSDADRAGTRPVAIVNETMASRYWPGQDPIGRRVRFDNDATAREIIGVVPTTKYQTLGEAPQPCLFLPLRQNRADEMVLYVRAAGDPDAVLGNIQREIRRLGPDVPILSASSVPLMMWRSLWMVQFAAGLFAVFGLIALTLASVGVYGMMAYVVSQRRRELGVRLALGARPSEVRGLVLRQGVTLAGIGIALGSLLALLLARTMASLLYGVSTTDLVSFGGAAATLAVVALIASLLPAWRASQLDPWLTLREP
jgi:putative ABC transport system permease protein